MNGHKYKPDAYTQSNAPKRAKFIVMDAWGFIPLAFLPLFFSWNYIYGTLALWVFLTITSLANRSPWGFISNLIQRFNTRSDVPHLKDRHWIPENRK